MTNKVQLARELSKHYHQGQTYGTSLDYFNYHIEGVVASLRVHGVDDDVLVVAYLHDALEDTSCTYETIESLFGTKLAEAVLAITKLDTQSRPEYLARCADNKLSRIVKLHDAMFNATNCFKSKNTSRFNYYIDTINQLKVV